METIKFITTFSKNGYYVYGKSWIESFLEFTKDYPSISAKVYIDGMDLDELKSTYNNRIEFVDFDVAIPNHKVWLDYFQKTSTHGPRNKELSIKFSFKSFVMINELKINNNNIVVWLDADSIFKSYDFDSFIDETVKDKFIACQREHASEHVESGIVIFNTQHYDKQVFLDTFESFYTVAEKFNSFGQFYDGFVIYRTLDHSQISYIDLNKGYGVEGIQSDPNYTFLNPVLHRRFHHNIGISGKKNYQNWEDYSTKDKFFQLIHGVNQKSLKQIKEENLARAKEKLEKIRNVRD
jgi:hypothetical protein